MKRNRSSFQPAWLLAAVVLLLTACTPAATSTPTQIPIQPPAIQATLPPATETTPPTTQVPRSSPAPAGALREPQEIQFKAEDGQDLDGRYYPAGSSSAALVVLMHWAPGDQNDWDAVARWLAGMENPPPQPPEASAKPWLDPSWFPALPDMQEGESLAVFTFTFRNCEGGCKAFYREAWLMDARAAMIQAHELEGIDPSRIVAIGASIGSDGAADGCAWLNQQFPNSCLGALSLSPGGYLTIPYGKAVADLGAEQPPKPAWCLYAQDDGESKKACQDASGENYKSIEYPGSNHGMELLRPEVDPSALQILLDFLKLTLDI